jgi:hypothetical protein
MTIIPDLEGHTLQANNLKQVRQYIQNIDDKLPIDNMIRQCKTLYNTKEWTPKCANEFEKIDEVFTSTLLQAEQRLKKRHNLPWSPELDQAYAIYTYWRK